MATNKIVDSYDEIKGMLSKVRKLQAMPKYGIIQEQHHYPEGEMDNNPAAGNQMTQEPQDKGDEDLAVINNVDVEIHSEDPEDRVLKDEEKNTISQLIDDFRTEVSEIAEFYGLHIYPDTAVLNGKITDKGLNFTFEAGNENGALISTSMLKIDNESLDIINKLGKFGIKFSNTINDLLVNRREL